MLFMLLEKKRHVESDSSCFCKNMSLSVVNLWIRSGLGFGVGVVAEWRIGLTIAGKPHALLSTPKPLAQKGLWWGMCTLSSLSQHQNINETEMQTIEYKA